MRFRILAARPAPAEKHFPTLEPSVSLSDGAARTEEVAMAEDLEFLASPVRIAILKALRRPTPASKIVVGAAHEEQGGQGRPLSRQAVTRHLGVLLEAGLIRALPPAPGGRGPRYVVARDRLFALVDRVRVLSGLRPVPGVQWEPEGTLEVTEAVGRRMPEPPRLLVAYGADDRQAFALDPRLEAWVIGRGGSADLCVDHDPYASELHCRISRARKGFEVEDLQSSNGTFVNGAALPPGHARPVSAGDVLTVGRTVLVLQT